MKNFNVFLINYNIIYLVNTVLSVLQANANNAACLSEVDEVLKNSLKTLFHVSSVPFLTPMHNTGFFTSGGILKYEVRKNNAKQIMLKVY